MSHQHKCTYDRNELRVLRAGFEEAAELLGLETGDVGEITELAIAVFGLVRGADLYDGDRVIGVNCKLVERDDKLALALWISVADQSAHDSIGSMNDVARAETGTNNRAILRRMSIKQQLREPARGAGGANVRWPSRASIDCARARHSRRLSRK